MVECQPKYRLKGFRAIAVATLDNAGDPKSASDVPVEAERAIEAEAVSQILASLAPEQRQVLHLAYFSGLTHTEIASRPGLPLGTVKSRLRLALDHLRVVLSTQPGRSCPLSAEGPNGGAHGLWRNDGPRSRLKRPPIPGKLGDTVVLFVGSPPEAR